MTWHDVVDRPRPELTIRSASSDASIVTVDPRAVAEDIVRRAFVMDADGYIVGEATFEDEDDDHFDIMNPAG